MAFLTNYSKTQETVEEIPGLHRYLPRSEVTIKSRSGPNKLCMYYLPQIKNVMEAYMHKPGTFLLRPSLTTAGSLTLTVV